MEKGNLKDLVCKLLNSNASVILKGPYFLRHNFVEEFGIQWEGLFQPN